MTDLIDLLMYPILGVLAVLFLCFMVLPERTRQAVGLLLSTARKVLRIKRNEPEPPASTPARPDLASTIDFSHTDIPRIPHRKKPAKEPPLP
mgnify:CR=1 FL=1